MRHPGYGTPRALQHLCCALQVARHALAPERAAELPSPLAPPYVGRPHAHQYLAASRVAGPVKWGPQQVGLFPIGVGTQWLSE